MSVELGLAAALTHGDIGRCARGAERHVAAELLPDHARHVVEGADAAAGLVPGMRNLLDPIASGDEQHPAEGLPALNVGVGPRRVSEREDAVDDDLQLPAPDGLEMIGDHGVRSR
jgi:hypothetical protein